MPKLLAILGIVLLIWLGATFLYTKKGTTELSLNTGDGGTATVVVPTVAPVTPVVPAPLPQPAAVAIDWSKARAITKDDVDTTMSSVYDNLGPENCVAGGQSGKYCHTSNDAGESAWMQLDLRKDVPIKDVIITNRVDCCSNRVVPAKVTVTDSSGSVVASLDITAPFATLTIPINHIGRYIKIQLQPSSGKPGERAGQSEAYLHLSNFSADAVLD